MAAEIGKNDDTVDSGWWYWIAAYPILAVLAIPIALVFGVFIVAIMVLVDATTNATVPDFVVIIVVLVVGLLVITFLAVAFVIFAILPVALYFDAKAVSEATVDWDPDPFVYAILAALQFFVTPVIGFIIALYYLYQRHKVVGVP